MSYAALLAHDMKSPLGGLKTALQVLEDKPEQAKKLMTRSVMRMEEMISQLLEQDEAEQRKLNIQRTTAKDFGQQIQSDLKLFFGGYKNVSLNISTDGLSEQNDLFIDRCLIERAVMNLVKNAIEAMEQYHGRVFVIFRLKEENLQIEVVDNGPGIDQALIKKLGAQPVQSDKENGNGLGLYQCQSAAQAHTGELYIQSSGRGTKIMMTIPRGC